ncbi:MAG TPA: LysR family transcriptional regulator [Candidatus Pelethocola excrementipullorum]|nr:LysR family transcriptional regulator [Candidatus Pelethocola excrementipullorum]
MDHTLSQYYIFYIVALQGNISKAAEKLYISQPAISKSIRKLEKALNTPLFKRNSRGVTLTEDGELLYQHVQEAFAQLEIAEQTLERKHALGISHLRIGASSTLCKYVLLPYLQSFVAANPHVKITISCQSSYKTIELLQEQKIDIGLIGTPSSPKTYEFFPILSIHDTFVATDTYLNNLSLREEDSNIYHTATFMLLDEENITRQFINNYIKDQSLQLDNILEVSTMDLLIEFSKIGLGVGCVIKEFVQTELDHHVLTELPLGLDIPTREIGFACLKESRVLPPIQSFMEQVAAFETGNA